MNGTTCSNVLQAALKPTSNQILIQATRLATRAIASVASSGSIVPNTCHIQNTNASLKNKNRLTPSCHLLHSTPYNPNSSTNHAHETLEDRAKRIWDHYDQDHQKAMTDLAYSLSFASPESDFSSQKIQDLLSDEQRDQLANCEKSLDKYDTNRELLNKDAHQHPSTEELRTLHQEVLPEEDEEQQFHFEDVFALHDQPLPQTLQDALADPRAIVLTKPTPPFQIVHVNTTWEGLCGYTSSEAHHQTLSLLQGPETDTGAATALIDKLMHGLEAGTVLTNYTKSGRKFQNRIRVGCVRNEREEVTHFVGVLREIEEKGEHFGAGTEKSGRRMHA